MNNNPKLATEKQVQEVSDTFTELYNHQGKQIKALESGVIDAIEPSSPAPTKRGEYKVTKPGVFLNYKDANGQPISVTQEDYSKGNVSIIFNGTDCRVLIVPITFEGEVKEGDTRGVSGNTINKELDERSYLDTPYYGDKSLINNGIIIETFGQEISKYKLELSYLRNIKGKYGKIVQFVLQSDFKEVICDHVGEDDDSYYTGIKTLFVKSRRDYDVNFYVTIDFDKVGIESKIDRPGLFLDTNLIKDFPYRFNSTDSQEVISLLGRVSNLENNTNQEKTFTDNILRCSVNNVISDSFKEQFLRLNKNIEILLVGNSLTGLVKYSGEFTSEEKKRMPPGMISKHWSYLLWDNIVKNKPNSFRLNHPFFKTKGVYSEINSGKLDVSNVFGEFSTTSETFMTSDNSFETTWEWDMSKYEWSSIIFSKYEDATTAIINVKEGNGKIECSLDKSTWFELNDYVLNQKTNINNISETDLQLLRETKCERHRRLWLRKKTNETCNITIKKKADDNGFIYLYGADFWNGNTVFITNLGRGGRDISLLADNMSDIFNRNPDFVLLEMPLANEMNRSTSVLLNNYKDYLFSDVKPSFKNLSADFNKTSLTMFLPTDRSENWEENTPIKGRSVDMLPYNKYRRIFGTLLSESNIFKGLKLFNISDAIYDEINDNNLSINEGLSPSISEKSLTFDGVHLNKIGSIVWFKYIKAIFK